MNTKRSKEHRIFQRIRNLFFAFKNRKHKYIYCYASLHRVTLGCRWPSTKDPMYTCPFWVPIATSSLTTSGPVWEQPQGNGFSFCFPYPILLILLKNSHPFIKFFSDDWKACARYLMEIWEHMIPGPCFSKHNSILLCFTYRVSEEFQN